MVAATPHMPDARATMDAAGAERAYMARALLLAEQGLFTTTPNPRVGCVLVRAGRIIGEGFHERAGGPHAEVQAIADAQACGEDTRGATAYVTLEPCNHRGRTGPCSEALIRAGVARVVAAMADPDPVAGNGAECLRAAGIDVAIGLLEAEARDLNPGFISRLERGRPWVRLKVAASLDGRTALIDGRSQWITSAEARADGHRWRARACAILTGIGTVRQDDPQMTVRDVPTPRQPLRIVVDRSAQVPPHARVLQAGPVLIVTAGARNAAWPAGVELLHLPDGNDRIDLAQLMRTLAQREINEVHVEAGAGLNGALLEAGLVDELLLYFAPCVIGDPARGMADLQHGGLAALDQRIALEFSRVDRIGPDLRVLARVRAKEG